MSTLQKQIAETSIQNQHFIFFAILIACLFVWACVMQGLSNHKYTSNPRRQEAFKKNITDTLAIMQRWTTLSFFPPESADLDTVPQFRFGKIMFALGSLDYLARRNGLTDFQFILAGHVVLEEMLGFPEAESQLYLGNWNYLIEHEFSRKEIQFGGQSIQKWINDDDFSAVACFAEAMIQFLNSPHVPADLTPDMLLVNFSKKKLEAKNDRCQIA